MKGRSLRQLLVLLNLTLVPIAFSQTNLDELFSPSQLPHLRESKLYHVGSYDTAGHNNDFISIAAGKTATILNVNGPGAIARIWMTVAASDPYYLRRILIRIYWDGESNPSVEVPLGDFFGTGFGYKQYVSRFVGMTSGGFYSYFPMPFNKSAKIEIVNETGQTISSFYYNIDYQKVDQPFGADIGYFHAWWHRDIRTMSGNNYVILEAEGKGQFVGCNLNIQGYDSNLSFLEGDEMVYVDGESKPSVNGTGTEDFFNSGWYFNRGEYSAPYHGLIWKDDSASRIAAYRFMVGDAIPFQKSIRVTIEHGTENTETADYSSTAYWYQLEPHKTFPPILKASLRIPLRAVIPTGATEAESLNPTGANIQYKLEDMTDFGPEWRGGKELKVTPTNKRTSFVLAVPVGGADRYVLNIYYTKGPDYGNAAILVSSKKVGEIAGYSKSITPGGKVTVKNIISDGSPIRLEFVVRGKDAASDGYSAGLDAFVVTPERDFITHWSVIGPFPNPTDPRGERLGLDTPRPPEKEINAKKTYVGVNGQEVRWQRIKAGSDGMIDLIGRFSPEELVVAYAVSFVYSPKAQTLPLLFGSDDGVKVFLNGRELFRTLMNRPAVPDQDSVTVDLRKGKNTLLMKIENNTGGYGFFARFVDPGRTLKYKDR